MRVGQKKIQYANKTDVLVTQATDQQMASTFHSTA